MAQVANNTPAPFVCLPSQAWDGNDGSWSTFVLRVGTPGQDFRVLPSTSGQETFVPVPEGCISSDPSNCGSSRGVYPFDGRLSAGFQTNASSTWNELGLYDLGLGHELNYTGNGLYGLDTVGLGLQNSGGLTLDKRVVAGIATKDFYLGIFGLGPKASNFSDFDYPQASFLRTAKDKGLIPSLSFAYTAGASYRMPQQLGSLILGGYDTSRFTPNDQTFPFSSDDSKVLSTGVQRITTRNTLQGSVSPPTVPFLTVIDSTFPHIWLPRSICDTLASAFGLTYDAHTDLYLVNESIHTQLQNLQPSISFALGNSVDPEKMVTITLPYGAMDLQASHPIYDNATNYFPIRRAADDTQYTLGRAFLQEAYVIADYERSNFSIHQALFQDNMPAQDIVSITPLSNGSTNSTAKLPPPSGAPYNRLSTGTKIGIAVGVSLSVLLVAALLLLRFWRRRGRTRPDNRRDATNPTSGCDGELPTEDQSELHNFSIAEIRGGKCAWEMEAEVREVNLLSDDIASGYTPAQELSGQGVPQELPGET